jgi:hypothetical protein
MEIKHIMIDLFMLWIAFRVKFVRVMHALLLYTIYYELESLIKIFLKILEICTLGNNYVWCEDTSKGRRKYYLEKAYVLPDKSFIKNRVSLLILFNKWLYGNILYNDIKYICDIYGSHKLNMLFYIVEDFSNTNATYNVIVDTHEKSTILVYNPINDRSKPITTQMKNIIMDVVDINIETIQTQQQDAEDLMKEINDLACL